MSDAAELQAQEADAAPAAPAPGQVLAEARRAQNLSIADVANRLKLSVSQVEALEQEAYERLPGPVFVRGFTRNYARLLKLDADEAVHAVDARLPRTSAGDIAADDMHIPMPAGNTRRWPLYVGVIAVIFLGAALVDFLWPDRPVRIASAPSVEPAHAPVPAAPKPAVVGTSEGMNMGAKAGPASASAFAPAPTPQPAVSVVQTAAAPAPGDKQLKLAFDQQSWVEIRDGKGNVLLSQLNAPGTTREVNAAPPVSLVIGNSHNVHLTVDGSAVDLAPYTRVDVARLTLK